MWLWLVPFSLSIAIFALDGDLVLLVLQPAASSIPLPTRSISHLQCPDVWPLSTAPLHFLSPSLFVLRFLSLYLCSSSLSVVPSRCVSFHAGYTLFPYDRLVVLSAWQPAPHNVPAGTAAAPFTCTALHCAALRCAAPWRPFRRQRSLPSLNRTRLVMMTQALTLLHSPASASQHRGPVSLQAKILQPVLNTTLPLRRRACTLAWLAVTVRRLGARPQLPLDMTGATGPTPRPSW